MAVKGSDTQYENGAASATEQTAETPPKLEAGGLLYDAKKEWVPPTRNQWSRWKKKNRSQIRYMGQD